MPKRRRRKLAVPWTPILALATVGNVVAGLYLSPLCAVRRVRVEGAPDFEQERLAALLKSLKGRPALQVPPESVESQVLSYAGVEDAQFERNPFGSASLRVQYKTAVARLGDLEGWVLGADGARYRWPGSTEGLPSVRFASDAQILNLSMAGALPYLRVAQVAQRMQGRSWVSQTDIRVDASGSVSLYTGLPARIELGSAENLDEKFQTLDRLLDERENLLSEVNVLNLSAPSRPVVSGPIRPAPGTEPRPEVNP